MIHVAVVFAKRGSSLNSLKDHHGWKAFLGRSQQDAIDKAHDALEIWGYKSPLDQIPYVVYVGTLTGELKVVNPRPQTRVVPL